MLKNSKSQIAMNELCFTLCLKNTIYNFCCHFLVLRWFCYWEESPGQWVSPWFNLTHFWKEIPGSKLWKAKFISFRNKKNRDVCGTISTWHSLAHRGNRQETYGVAAWWKVGDFSTLTGLVEWILHCFHLTILLEKKNSACCLQNISVGNVRSMGHLAL